MILSYLGAGVLMDLIAIGYTLSTRPSMLLLSFGKACKNHERGQQMHLSVRPSHCHQPVLICQPCLPVDQHWGMSIALVSSYLLCQNLLALKLIPLYQPLYPRALLMLAHKERVVRVWLSMVTLNHHEIIDHLTTTSNSWPHWKSWRKPGWGKSLVLTVIIPTDLTRPCLVKPTKSPTIFGTVRLRDGTQPAVRVPHSTTRPSCWATSTSHRLRRIRRLPGSQVQKQAHNVYKKGVLPLLQAFQRDLVQRRWRRRLPQLSNDFLCQIKGVVILGRKPMSVAELGCGINVTWVITANTFMKTWSTIMTRYVLCS